MVYVALLRGINVGGNSIISMAGLKSVFEQLGFTSVATYINSGNVIFGAPHGDPAKLAATIQAAIERDFGLTTPTLVLSRADIERVAAAVPPAWVNNHDMKCDVMFLWPEVDSPDTLEGLSINPDIEDAIYIPGAITWRVDRTNQSRSRVPKIIGAPLYRQITTRNVNTVRKILGLMQNA